MSEELAQLVSELPAVFEQVLAALPSILPAIAYYQSFVQYTTQRCVAMVTIKAPMSISYNIIPSQAHKDVHKCTRNWPIETLI